MVKFIVIFVMAFATLLQADYVLKYNMDGEKQTFMYHSSLSAKLSMSGSDEEKNIYKIGKKVYVVSTDNGKKTVMDLDKLKEMQRAMGFDSSAYQQEVEKPQYSIKKTGKKVKVAGINGELWIVSGKEDGESYKVDMVVTKDKRVVKAVREMFSLFASMSGGTSGDNFYEIQKGYVTIKTDGLVLESFSEKKVSATEYKLPTDSKQMQMPTFGSKKGKSETPSNSKQTQKEAVNKNVDDAVNMLKSFF